MWKPLASLYRLDGWLLAKGRNRKGSRWEQAVEPYDRTHPGVIPLVGGAFLLVAGLAVSISTHQPHLLVVGGVYSGVGLSQWIHRHCYRLHRCRHRGQYPPLAHAEVD